LSSGTQLSECLDQGKSTAYAVGIMLAGMEKDGAKKLNLMKENGAVTIVQDEESFVIHGMPGP